MSGAGRSTAAGVLEDLGWFVIDNLPPALMGKVAELVGEPRTDSPRVALVVGRGGTEYVAEYAPALEALREAAARVRVLFLDAADDVLVRRFEGTRRRHPLAAQGVVGSIAAERELLGPIKDRADVVLDTSELNVHELRGRLLGLFEPDDPSSLVQTNVVSFGYKHGIPLDVDLVLDCRFLPNPHWVEALRPYSGLDEPVRSYVLGQPDAKAFLEKVDDLLGLLLPGYVREGKSYLSIAVGCTGGRHRSVVIAEELAAAIRRRGLSPTVVHRDVER
ncbi:MAG: RNase adapter RapZ [Acidimicrobiales bacterium]